MTIPTTDPLRALERALEDRIDMLKHFPVDSMHLRHIIRADIAQTEQNAGPANETQRIHHDTPRQAHE